MGFAVHAVGPGGGAALTPPADAVDVHAALEGPGPAVYTALRTFSREGLLLLDRHLDRLADSAARAGIDTGVDAAAIRRCLAHACADWPGAEAKVRIDVRQDPLPWTDARVLVGLWSFEPPDPVVYRDGVAVASAPGARRAAPRAKTSDWISARRAWIGEDSYYEHVLLDAGGGMLEGFTSNLWFVREGRLITAEEGVLHGITRGLLLEVAEALGLPVERRAFPLAAAGTLDEAALSSSSRALVPIVSIDGRPVGDGRPGPVTGRLLRAYRARVEDLVAPA